MTVITAIMLMIYKRKNGLGYSEAKFLFKTEMNDYILVLGVFLWRGYVTIQISLQNQKRFYFC